MRGRLRSLLAVWVLVLAPLARAEDKDIIVVGWFDHFTYGLVNTAIGLPIALAGMAYNGIAKGEKPEVRIDSTGQQIELPSANWTFYNYSTGAIHHGECCDAHEAGHAKQAAALGPMFLPVVGLSYLVEGISSGTMEDWADAWADLGSTMVNSRPYRMEFEIRDRDGKSAERVGFNFVILERASNVDVDPYGSKPTSIVYSYGKIGVYLLVPRQGTKGEEVFTGGRLNATVFQKDFSAKWEMVGGIFSILLDAKQETGAVSWDMNDGRVQSKILSHTLGMGVRVGDESVVAVDAIGRAIGGVEGLWLLKAGERGAGPGMMLTGGFGVELRAHLLKFLQLFGRKTWEWGTGGYTRETETLGAETPAFFAPGAFTDQDRRPLPFYGGVSYMRETETFPDLSGEPRSTQLKFWMLNLGGRW